MFVRRPIYSPKLICLGCFNINKNLTAKVDKGENNHYVKTAV